MKQYILFAIALLYIHVSLECFNVAHSEALLTIPKG